jgi:hypothetical protein
MKFISKREIKLTSLFLISALPLIFSGCSERATPQQSSPSVIDSKPATPSIQQGSLPTKVVELKQSPYKRCEVYIEGTNNSQSTLSMTLNVIFKTPQNQVIESSLRVFTARGGQTSIVDLGVQENCSEIGSVVITDTTTCQLDGQFVNNDVCWNQLSPQTGVIPIVK